ncbi:glycoside hydrolase [Subsaximicrobium wynnwilliamsii]|uniref:Glycoside hydrolase n=1 Tax=Subsaximicrobium wynnwilliamsii TaxID=291179 RepID=A0A5C6ZHI6_9FLAO|nr:glycoside hydrolase [Subsaximicrobium wynnwilliamsii]TXD83524.1 glycoside hydrolase [Subsaximicrobium wynnwilliamsii]TXD89201.1 glycoside hydrolase [Subsaximicrobium wynnwilliamsii]TXE03204.1 glycoside hydrolase [Subsaximicrobium wynnwilliamsii]
MTYFKWFVCCLLLTACFAKIETTEKIDAVSFVASRHPIDSSHTKALQPLNANYAALMPFGFIKDLAHPDIIYNTDRQWFGETEAGVKQYAETLRKANIKIMVKPQIWVWRGEFTGNIKMTTEADWQLLEAAYTKFILEYAHVAKDIHAEVFCIGTELENFVVERPEYWEQLIAKIKTIYHGKLTYAANWDEYRRTPFWDDLDYIGVDAYFPVSQMKTPTVADCRAGWQKHKTLLKSISEDKNKPILFTEFGYRSMDFAGNEHWQSDHNIKTLNLEGQANATEALFEEFWTEPWFAGGFVWKWHQDHHERGGDVDNQFTPQNKPAQEVIARFYGK